MHVRSASWSRPHVGKGTTKPPFRILVGALLVTLFNAIALAAWWFGRELEFAMEYGPLEQAQLFLLSVSFILFVYEWYLAGGPEKTASGALAMLSAAALVREIDVKKLNGPEWYNWLAHHGLQEILFVAMTVPILWYLVRRRNHWIGLFRLLAAPAAIPLILAGAFLSAGVYFDSRVVVGTRYLFWEELFELNGYLFLIWSAFNHWVIVRRRFDQVGRCPA
jgi:hypothetical protein